MELLICETHESVAGYGKSFCQLVLTMRRYPNDFGYCHIVEMVCTPKPDPVPVLPEGWSCRRWDRGETVLRYRNHTPASAGVAEMFFRRKDIERLAEALPEIMENIDFWFPEVES